MIFMPFYLKMHLIFIALLTHDSGGLWRLYLDELLQAWPRPQEGCPGERAAGPGAPTGGDPGELGPWEG